jgi:hypothetical protein
MTKFSIANDVESRGQKIASRRDVNQSLSVVEAFDERLFVKQISRNFGIDRLRPGQFSIMIKEENSGLVFEAYANQSGPSYGGPIEYLVHDGHGLKLRSDVAAILTEFELLISDPKKKGDASL